MSRAPFLTSILLLTSCAATPPYAVESASGTVRARDAATAERAVRELEQASALLRDELPGLDDVRPTVWIQDSPQAGWLGPRTADFSAFTLHSKLPGFPRIHVPTESFEANLTHELLHALVGESWDPLPDALEEGLGDVMQLRRRSRQMLRAARLAAVVDFDVPASEVKATLPGPHSGEFKASWTLEGVGSEGPRSQLTLEQALSFEGIDGWSGLDRADMHYVYGLGYLLVDRIVRRHGLAYLWRMCLDARREGRELLSVEEILEAAGLEGPAEFEQVARREFYRLLHQLAFEGDVLAAALQKIHELHEPSCQTPEEFVRTHQPRLRLLDRPETPLWELRGFSSWLRRHWPEISAHTVPRPEGF